MGLRVSSMEEATAAIDAAVSTALQKAAYDMEAHAVRVVPVDTGRLKASIHLEFEGTDTAKLVAGVEYAEFVEFGTGQRGIATHIGSLPKGYTYGKLPGMRAQPFMRPAVHAFVKRYFPKRLKQELRSPSTPRRKRSGAEKVMRKINRAVGKLGGAV